MQVNYYTIWWIIDRDKFIINRKKRDSSAHRSYIGGPPRCGGKRERKKFRFCRACCWLETERRRHASEGTRTNRRGRARSKPSNLSTLLKNPFNSINVGRTTKLGNVVIVQNNDNK